MKKAAAIVTFAVIAVLTAPIAANAAEFGALDSLPKTGSNLTWVWVLAGILVLVGILLVVLKFIVKRKKQD